MPSNAGSDISQKRCPYGEGPEVEGEESDFVEVIERAKYLHISNDTTIREVRSAARIT